MIWTEIIISGRTGLHIIRNGSLTAQKCADETLNSYVVPYAAANGKSFLLMQDNTRPHTARLVENFLKAEIIQRMD
ncbi:hypothetical protein TNCV_835791 [Trichonephila clavipes]|nr:hypothetical protein TNCV_835791 [Trichonephila clavipes]